jgi:hypothetical protein
VCVCVCVCVSPHILLLLCLWRTLADTIMEYNVLGFALGFSACHLTHSSSLQGRLYSISSTDEKAEIPKWWVACSKLHSPLEAQTKLQLRTIRFVTHRNTVQNHTLQSYHWGSPRAQNLSLLCSTSWGQNHISRLLPNPWKRPCTMAEWCAPVMGSAQGMCPFLHTSRKDANEKSWVYIFLFCDRHLKWPRIKCNWNKTHL